MVHEDDGNVVAYMVKIFAPSGDYSFDQKMQYVVCVSNCVVCEWRANEHTRFAILSSQRHKMFSIIGTAKVPLAENRHWQKGEIMLNEKNVFQEVY